MPVRRAALVLLGFLVVASVARAGDAPAPGAGPERPRLVVLVVVDQLGSEHLERFGARLSAYGGGFRRLAREGAWWSEARHRHACTFTAPGHATIATGADPSVHGIVNNEWWERGGSGGGRLVYCVDDPACRPFGAPGVEGTRRVGPANLRAETLGDALKGAPGGAARVVGVSVKDRSAILLAGRRADAAFWFDPKAGGFVASASYPFWTEGDEAARTARRDAWERRLLRFNAEVVPSFVGTWALDPRAVEGYPEAAADGRPAEGADATFPHAPRHRLDLTHLERSPAADEMVLAFLEALVPLGAADAGAPRPPDVERLALGAREGVTDLLAVSFSALDLVGHRYGPDSQEAADVLGRLDAVLARLLDALDRRVGAGRWVAAVAADHGVAPLPEAASAQGLDAGRLLEPDVRAIARAALGADAVAAVRDGNVWLEGTARTEAAATAVRDALLAHPAVHRAWTRAQVLDGRVPLDPVGLGLLRSFDPRRSGDVLFVLRPLWVYAGPVPGTTHGTPWAYDARVPLFLLGPGIVPGPRVTAAETVDVAPTIAALLGIPPPSGSEGRVLWESLDLGAWGARRPLR